MTGAYPSDRGLIHVCHGLDLHEHPRVDERSDLHHRRHRCERAEAIAVRAADLVGAGDVGDVHPRLYDLTHPGTRARERRLDRVERDLDLAGGVAGRTHDPVLIDRRRPGDEDEVAGPDRAAVAEATLPRSARAEALDTLHLVAEMPSAR